jgi:hypothetical protein
VEQLSHPNSLGIEKKEVFQNKEKTMKEYPLIPLRGS